jgi:hypothetical protein
MRKTLAASFVALIAAATLSSCGASTVTQSDVEDQIVSKLVDENGDGPDSASCPDDLTAEKGETMTCTATTGDTTVDVKVTVTKVDGDNVLFDIEVV